MKQVPANQTRLDALFAPRKTRKASPVRKPTTQTLKTPSETPEIERFYASLRPAEVIAHEIAKEKLGTSYDVQRTHGFRNWKKAQG
jgi:hypothetical protein